LPRPKRWYFYLDVNGNGRWDKVAGGDRVCGFHQGGSPIVGNWDAASRLTAAGGPAAAGAAAGEITTLQVAPLVQQAIDTYASLQLTAAQQHALRQVDVRIADLPGATLGRALGSTITLDINAAGHGWFVDATPRDDSEFSPHSAFRNLHSMDLLTAVMHEIGHVLGYDHTESGVMQDTLPVGVRRLADELVETADRKLNQDAVDAVFAGS
jgi:hypothetical protein